MLNVGLVLLEGRPVLSSYRIAGVGRLHFRQARPDDLLCLADRSQPNTRYLLP